MPALPTTPKPSAGDASWLMDENLSDGMMHTSLEDLNISDSPLTQPFRSTSSNTSASAKVKRPMKSRPSWGSAPVLDSANSAKAMSKMRLLAGLDRNDENRPPVARKGGAGAGGGRPRFSLFAKPGVPTNLIAKKKHDEEEDEDDVTINAGGLPEASDIVSSSMMASSIVDADLESEEYIREALSGKRSSARQSTGGPTPSESRESQEQIARQLAELRRMNEVFEAYERMLRGSAGQINAFARRVQETDDLLNIYIALLRQTEKTQQLLQDADWKGTTEDAEAHQLSVALAERETQRLQAEAREREAASRRAAQEEEARRLAEEERERLEEARRAAGGGRGRGGRTVSGSARGSARGASTASAFGRGATASTRGSATTRGSAGGARGRSASTLGSGTGVAGRGTGTSRPSGIPTRAVSSSAGLGGQYANVKSSGYGPR